MVLGPLAATVDGQRVNLGGPRQRRLLAALAVDAGEVVSADRLVDRLWGDGDLPADPRRTIRTYVARLRQALGNDATVVAEAPGWRLVTDLAEPDALTFAALVDRSDQPELNVHQRLGILDEALALWQGDAFEEVADEPWARSTVDRLTELRATAVQRRFEAMLEAGLHTDALPGLASAAADDPLRSRLVELRMLALHRAGRQAEATRVFQAHHRWLGDELGLEPSQELVELDRRILADDPSLLLTERPGRALRSYRLGDQLGEGAFAVVYRGTQPSVGREVAIKVIRAELANRPEFVRRFEAEAQLVARLEHPHIVPLYDYWREPDRACLVLRYLRGGTLEARLTKAGGLSLEESGQLVAQVGSSLATAHAAGVVHRDVKPANIFLDELGNYYLGDFGIALEAAELADPTAALSAGSPAYASPEQLRREPIGPTADVHGLGVSIYEALTARLPFPDAATQAELLDHQLNDPIPAVQAVRPDIPSAVDEVLAKATAKAPADRYQSVEALMAAFATATELARGGPTGGAGGRLGAATVNRLEEARNPYKGLRPFSEADARDFFGRERLVDRLIDTFDQTGTSGRIAAVIGPSGIGKSSVVRAGLLPQLRRGRVPGSDQWLVATMVPGRDPYDELAAALLRVASRVPDNLMSVLGGDDRGIARVVKSLVSDDDGSEVLLVIDQFEELFTLVDDSTVRRRFLNAIEHAITDARCPLRVIMTVRADFWDQPLRYGSFARLIEPSIIHVTALAPDELERAIVEPAQRSGTAFEPGLVSRIVAEVADEPGALPLLQYALTELWDDNVSGLMTLASYQRLGGVAGALSRRAEEIYQEASPPQRAAIRRVLGRLVTLGQGTDDTRRRVLRAELGSDAVVGEVIEVLGRARLLSFDRDPASREPTVEVAHEALIRRWPRFRDWLDEDRDGLRLVRHLSAAAAEWHQSGQPASELYRGGRLEAAEERIRTHPADLSPGEQAFIDASTQLRQAEEAAARDRFDQQVRTNRHLRTLLAGVGVLLVMALVAGGSALVQRNRADDERARAERNASLAEDNQALAAAQAARAEENAVRAEEAALVADVQRLTTESRLALGVDPDLAILLALEAFDQAQSLDETPGQVVSALQTATQNSRLQLRIDDAARWVALRADGQVVATGTPIDPRVVVLSEADGGEEIGRIAAPGPVAGATYAPDGSLLVVFAEEVTDAERPTIGRDGLRRNLPPDRRHRRSLLCSQSPLLRQRPVHPGDDRDRAGSSNSERWQRERAGCHLGHGTTRRRAIEPDPGKGGRWLDD